MATDATTRIFETSVEELPVPRIVELDEFGQGLRWRMGRSMKGRPVSPSLLADFVELQDEQDILAFAKTNGVFGLCIHGVPFTHRLWSSDVLAPTEKGCKWFQEGDLFCEPLYEWRLLINALRGARALGIELRHRSSGAVKDWTPLGTYFAVHKIDWEIPAADGRTVYDRFAAGFDDAVTLLLRIAQVRVEFDRTGGGPPLILRRAGLYGALVYQLVEELVGPSGLSKCSSCPALYSPLRRPKRNQRNFCPRCRDQKIPQKLAMQDYRESHNKRRKVR